MPGRRCITILLSATSLLASAYGWDTEGNKPGFDTPMKPYIAQTSITQSAYHRLAQLELAKRQPSSPSNSLSVGSSSPLLSFDSTGSTSTTSSTTTSSTSSTSSTSTSTTQAPPTTIPSSSFPFGSGSNMPTTFPSSTTFDPLSDTTTTPLSSSTMSIDTTSSIISNTTSSQTTTSSTSTTSSSSSTSTSSSSTTTSSTSSTSTSTSTTSRSTVQVTKTVHTAGSPVQSTVVETSTSSNGQPIRVTRTTYVSPPQKQTSTPVSLHLGGAAPTARDPLPGWRAVVAGAVGVVGLL